MFVVKFLLLLTFIEFVYSQDDVKTWVVNLDAPPQDRWPMEEMAPYYNDTVHKAVALIGELMPEWLEPAAITLAQDFILPHLGDSYAEEIKAGACCLGLPVGVGVLLNIFYEIEAGCTSIVAQDSNGHMYHGRNLDFDLADVLRKLVIRVEFQKGNKTLFYGATFAGYVGVLTGMKPGSFAISLNQRDSGYILDNILEALLIPGTTVSAFLIRDTLENVANFDGAMNALTQASLVAPAYIIVSGSNAGEGAVITRNRLPLETDVWRLDINDNRWYEVQTNDDHWDPPEDDRRDVAINGMSKLGQGNLNLDGIFSVLSIYDVLNPTTTYTAIMSATTGNFTVHMRN